jgi:hypothetical protein
MDIILGLHGLVRWLVVIVAVVAVIRYGLVMAGRAQPGGMDRGLMSGYTGLLDLNVLLGLILIVGLSISAGQLMLVWVEHAATNLVGVAVAHIFAQRAKKQADNQASIRQRLIGVVASLLIIIVGVTIVGGWAR